MNTFSQPQLSALLLGVAIHKIIIGKRLGSAKDLASRIVEEARKEALSVAKSEPEIDTQEIIDLIKKQNKKIDDIQAQKMAKDITGILNDKEMTDVLDGMSIDEIVKETVANFYENLSKASENRKKALLFVASQNPNLKDELFGTNEEETP